jgi:ABC-type nickel/cobalt efflux system permease component RcnA
MNRLRVCNGLLAVVLTALSARALVSGLTITVGLSAAIIMALLAASVLLTVHGRGLDPDQPRRSDARSELGEKR